MKRTDGNAGLDEMARERDPISAKIVAVVCTK